MRVTIPTLAPSRRDQPPIVITISSPAETSSTKATSDFVVFVSAFSLFGRQSSYPGRTLVASINRQSRISARSRAEVISRAFVRLVSNPRTWRNWHTRQV